MDRWERFGGKMSSARCLIGWPGVESGIAPSSAEVLYTEVGNMSGEAL